MPTEEDKIAEYASFDPGKITGYCTWNAKAQLLRHGQVTNDELIDLLDEDHFKTVKTVIIEDYKLFSWKAKQQSGSRMHASEAIGILLPYIRRGRKKEVRQPSNILPIASNMTNVKMPSNHAQSHWVSAFLHGAYYLIKQGIYETPLMEQARKKREANG